MNLYDIIVTLVTGAVSGWLAGIVMDSQGGLVRNIILGIVGGIVGNFLFGLLNISISLSVGPFNFGTIIVSAIGACIVIILVNKLFK